MSPRLPRPRAEVRSAESRRSAGRARVLYLLALFLAQCCAYLLLAPGAPPVPVPPVPPVASTKMPTANASEIIIANYNSGLAGRQSFGFFYDVTDEHWDLLRRIYLEHANHLDPERPLKFNPENEDRRGIETWGDPEMFSSYKAWYQSCDPHRIRKLAADRRAKDPNSPGCVVYSIGSSGSFIFEMGMQKEMGEGVCEYHIFDYGDYERRVPKELKRAHYHKWGLQKQDPNNDDGKGPTPGRAYYGLQDTIKLLGHEGLDVIDVFKIDCEKCEWETYADWLADDVPRLHQILVEVHGAPGRTAVDFFDSLEGGGYLRFHKEPNIQYNPGCVEYAFVKVETSFMEGKTKA